MQFYIVQEQNGTYAKGRTSGGCYTDTFRATGTPKLYSLGSARQLKSLKENQGMKINIFEVEIHIKGKVENN